MRGRISNWIPAPPTIAEELELELELDQDQFSTPPSLSHDTMLPIPIPNTALGSLRTASIFDSRVFGLRLTEDNIHAMLRLARGVTKNEEKSARAARDILNFLARWNELISVSEADLDYLESTWVGDIGARNRELTTSQSVKFYVLVEFATFMTNTDSWNIAKELTYLAVSKPALDTLILEANFQQRRPEIDLITRKDRPCSESVWRAALECLRLGSPWQHFSTAVSCTLVSLYSLPQQARPDNPPKTEALGFGYIRRSRLRDIVERFHKICETKRAPKLVRVPFGASENNLASRPIKQDVIPKPEEITFMRVAKRRQHTSQQQEHNDQLCERCRCVSSKFKNDFTLSRTDQPELSDYGMVLVEALDFVSGLGKKHDLCLFAFDIIPEITDNTGLATAVDDLLQSNKMYHTIRHHFPRQVFTLGRIEKEDTIWNLPLPYRRPTKRQRLDAQNWVFELRGEAIPVEGINEKKMNYWGNLQFLLYFLNQGFNSTDAFRMAKATSLEFQSWKRFFRSIDWEKRKNEEQGGRTLSEITFMGTSRSLSDSLSTKGDKDTRTSRHGS